MQRILVTATALCAILTALLGAAPASGPNIVLIFLDDSGWADLPPFGQPAYATPHVERLAQEGCAFRNVHVPQAVCSASRAALLSGCYPGRTRVFGAHGPHARGLDPQYATLGQVLQRTGYRTAVFGKWHIGDQPETRPWARGFDASCGLMYSNDMWEFHPENPKYWGRFPLQFWEGNRVSIPRVQPKHQQHLTQWYTEHAVAFIEANAQRPFFLYLPHSMPHVPLFCSERFAGRSGVGLYGDVMMEIDWSIGQVLDALDRHHLTDHTLVILTSDNGPWIAYGNHAGKTPFREAKGTGFDGGIRSACLMRYPGHIPAGTDSQRHFSTVDLLPTLARLAGAALPENPIDGRDVWPLITGRPDAANPHPYYPVSTGSSFEAVISGDGRWKYHRPHAYRTLVTPGRDGRPGKYRQTRIDAALFDMVEDPYETTNVIARYPKIAQRLRDLAAAHHQRFYARPAASR